MDSQKIAGETQDDALFNEPSRRVCKYPALITSVVRGKMKVVDVLVDDVVRWVSLESSKPEWQQLDLEVRSEALKLAEKIEHNTLRYMGLLEELLDQMVKEEQAKVRAAQQTAGGHSQSDGFSANATLDDENHPALLNAMLLDSNGEHEEAVEGAEGAAEERALKLRSVQAKLRRR